jgi:hypothetical protein
MPTGADMNGPQLVDDVRDHQVIRDPVDRQGERDAEPEPVHHATDNAE